MAQQRVTQARTATAISGSSTGIQNSAARRGTSYHPLLKLQQTIGNRAVQRMMQAQPGKGINTAAMSNCTVQRQVDDIDPTDFPPGHTDTELPGGGTLEDPAFPPNPKVPTIEGPPEGGFPELPPGGSMAGEGAAAGESAAAGEGAAAGLGAEAILPVALAGAAGAGAGYGMAKIADSSYTKTGAFGTDADTGKNQSAMDWGASWGTDWDKAHNQGQASVTGGALAAAGGIVGGIGGAVYGAGNWLADKL